MRADHYTSRATSHANDADHQYASRAAPPHTRARSRASFGQLHVRFEPLEVRAVRALRLTITTLRMLQGLLEGRNILAHNPDQLLIRVPLLAPQAQVVR